MGIGLTIFVLFLAAFAIIGLYTAWSESRVSVGGAAWTRKPLVLHDGTVVKSDTKCEVIDHSGKRHFLVCIHGMKMIIPKADVRSAPRRTTTIQRKIANRNDEAPNPYVKPIKNPPPGRR